MKLEMIGAISAVSAVAVLIAHHDQKHSPDNQLAQDLMQAPPKPVQLPVIPALPPFPFFPLPVNDQPVKSTEYFVTLSRTEETVPSTKDPVWELNLVDKSGVVIDTLKALSGRASRQTANRHTAGNKSPLPVGTYRIDKAGIAHAPFEDPELGKGYWVPISPLFDTGRSALGFHQDPSWGKLNGESGTSGCIGLDSPKATAKLVDWIETYKVKVTN
jgi:hypothetical protein